MATNGEGIDALAVEGIAVQFGERQGLIGVSLVVAPGERLAVLGASGAGKTTLLRAIAGLSPVTAGRVLVRGRDVTSLPPEQRDAVYLHQSPVLFPHLSVADNVAFPLRVRGQRGVEADRRVLEMLTALRLAELAGRTPATLSGGQRHRVALARAMVAGPAALLLDEPLAALDPALRADVRGAIADAQSAQRDAPPALVLVTHDLDDAALLADRVAVLLDGGVAQVATPALLFARPTSLAVARFLGLFQELAGETRSDGATACALGVVPPTGEQASRAAGRAVVAYRADAVQVVPADVEYAAPARVLGVRHRAYGVSVLLRVDDGTAAGVTVECALPAPAVALPVGTQVGVRLNTARALVFPG